MKQFLIFIILMSTLIAKDELNFEDDFLQSLDEVSEIATKTKLNIDETPSFVTILHSKKLQKLGITNVFEALSLVPGVQLSRELSGVPIVIFRGLNQKGEVKLLIDGVTINNSYRGSSYYYLDFPIELIERIEVIRGAGSVLYGSGAMSGVVNIITKTSQKDAQNSFFISGGSYDDYKAGALFSTKLNDLTFSLDSYYHKNNKIFTNDKHLEDYSVGFNISDEHLSLLGRVKKSTIGNSYGVFGVNDGSTKSIDNKNRALFTQLTYKNNLSLNNKISFLLGYSKYAQEVEAIHSSLGKIQSKYAERTYFSQVDINSKSFTNNTLLVGIRVESSRALKAQWNAPIPFLVNPNSSRDTISTYANNQYAITHDLDISAGLRYDDYSDFGDSFSPNLGLVYRYSNRLIFKTLYSHAYRAPSWIELTSNSDLQAEKSDTLEGGVIYKNNKNTTRINFYATTIKDMITKPSTSYTQKAEARFYGSEFEYIYTLNYQTELNIFASYIDAKDENKNNLPNIANILASSSITYQLDSGVTFGSLLKYVSSIQRETDIAETRSDMSSSLIFDETVSYIYKSLTVNLTIKDFFNQGTHYALPISYNTQLLDYDESGRTIMLNLSMNF